MIKKATIITILVEDQDKALEFYTKKLGFELHTDAPMEDDSRWLTVNLPDQKDLEFALLKPESEDDYELIGYQGGSYGIGALTTDDCMATYQSLKERGVEFDGEPTKEPWGIGVAFKDLYGNQFYLNQEIKAD